MTDFPTKGEDQSINLRNSNHPQFDRAFAEDLKADHPDVWGAGGNTRGNDAFVLWGRAREGSDSAAVLDWIKEREAWAARHMGDGSQFPEDSPTMSNIAGVVAAIKWGVILAIGESAMKTAVRDLIAKGYDRTTETIMERRFRTTNIEARQNDPESTDEPRVEGYATTFGDNYDLGPFTESIDRSAFKNVMGDDVRMLFNHDPNFPLARSKNGEGTLEMRVDDRGVFFSFPVGPQSYAKDLHESIKRGDVDQASFAFTVESDEWEERDGKPHRHITRLGSLTDLSVVTYPANAATEVMARSLPEVPKAPPTQQQTQVEERETTDRKKWWRSKLALAKLKQTNR